MCKCEEREMCDQFQMENIGQIMLFDDLPRLSFKVKENDEKKEEWDDVFVCLLLSIFKQFGIICVNK